jgi:hypothetical protein
VAGGEPTDGAEIENAPFDADFATLKLYANEAEDLTIVASVLQDSVVRRSELTYLALSLTFAGVFSRYRWEADRGGGERVRAGLRFRGVLSVQSRDLASRVADSVLEFLTIQADTGEDGAGSVTLLFSGGEAIRLATECIDCEISAIGTPWLAARRPAHPIVDEG